MGRGEARAGGSNCMKCRTEATDRVAACGRSCIASSRPGTLRFRPSSQLAGCSIVEPIARSSSQTLGRAAGRSVVHSAARSSSRSLRLHPASRGRDWPRARVDRAWQTSLINALSFVKGGCKRCGSSIVMRPIHLFVTSSSPFLLVRCL